jgi:hypothetical protein
MAFPTPPPGSPTGVGRLTKKEGVSPAAPWETTSHSRDASGMTAPATPRAQTAVQNTFTNRRQRIDRI